MQKIRSLEPKRLERWLSFVNNQVGSCLCSDRDRDFEAPHRVSECHLASAVPGYVDYDIHHGARLKIDLEDGRFVFFYLPLDDLWQARG
jgi:hypothetical protein